MRTAIVFLFLGLFVFLSCSREAPLSGVGGAVPVSPRARSGTGGLSWELKPSVGWENLRAWVPSLDESFWAASDFDAKRE